LPVPGQLGTIRRPAYPHAEGNSKLRIRNTAASPTQRHPDWLPRLILPLLSLTGLTVAAVAFQPPREVPEAVPLEMRPLPTAVPREASVTTLQLFPGDPVPALPRPLSGAPPVPRTPTTSAPDAGRLPVWVQAHRATALWSGPDSQAVRFTDLPQWTFLKVDGAERLGRLLVSYAGDFASRQPGIGWIDQSAIGPAGDPGRWVTNHRPAALWSGVDANALRFNDLPQWTALRIVEGAPPDAARLEVDFFGDGLTRQAGRAWIGRADVGPITPPVPLPRVTATTRQMEKYTFASEADFIDTVGAAAHRSSQTTGVPASVTVAQAILESDWGRSRLSREGNNLFGIKALGSVTGPAGVVTLATWEHVDTGDVVVDAPFKAYYTLEQSIDDHGGFFTRNKRYRAALAVADDARAFAREIQDAGYATDPSYASKLIELMDRYDLYRFDD